MRTLTRLATVSALATSALFGLSTAAHAEAAPGCSDTYQLGSTGYIDVDGQRAASVKQFWSPKCQANFAYVYLWQSFRTSHPGKWTVLVGLTVPGRDPVGMKYYPDTTGSEFWSAPFAGRGVCTYGYASIYYTVVDAGDTDGHCG
ncbi:hypothetical protein Lfu02_28110 [Longispora fulva]|uniref:Secreted protein n=1 Tax=Longispora fulva TaxID=619741 RepID=A0A8J7GWG1_9ACTN|nr:hypothetical protein [Longispora fulva]MBG6138946.1 hypothetical protein [Longispora fulva]GIG58439.1 hypothetical protein Lfu02_28110 [Longispora fulva]